MTENKAYEIGFFATMAGLVASDLIPTLGDALYFKKMKKLRDEWARGEVTPIQYWSREAFYYYTFNSGWWLLVGTSAYLIANGDYKLGAKLGIGMLGASFVLGVFAKNVKKDNAEQLQAYNKIKESIAQKYNVSGGDVIADYPNLKIKKTTPSNE